MIYRFQNITIELVTVSDELTRMINDFTHLVVNNEISEEKISITFTDDFEDEISKLIPEDALIQLDVPCDIGDEVRYKYYQRGPAESWIVFEGYGMVHTNHETGEIFSYRCRQTEFLDITGFIVLFIHPLSGMLRKFDYFRLHAACLNVNDKNILITGLSGRGKSTATFALIKEGHRVLSDEMPLLKKDKDCFQACSFVNMIKLRRQALDRFFPDFNSVAYESGEDCYIKLNDINHQGLQKLPLIHQIFILEQTGKVESTISPVSPLKVVPELFPSSVSVFQVMQAPKTFETITDFLSTVACYKVYFGTDMQKFVAAVEQAGSR